MMSVNQNEFITSSVVGLIFVLVVNNVARSLSVGYQILMFQDNSLRAHTLFVTENLLFEPES